MKLLFRKVLGLSLAAAVTAAGYAAEDDDIPVEYLRQLDNSISIGMRVRSKGPKVKFGNLGAVPANTGVGDTTTKGTRFYNNGIVAFDSKRTEESITDTTQVTFSSDGTRYQILADDTNDLDGDGSTTNKIAVFDYLSYQTDKTRSWSYNNDSQYNSSNGTIAMSVYNATSSGASMEAEGSSEGGFELQFEHTLGKIGKKLEWGIVGSFGLNDLNIKKSGRILSNLHTLTDYYQLTSPIPSPAPTFGPTYRDLTLTNASSAVVTVTTNGYETTTTLEDTPGSDRKEYDTVGGAIVDGNWQIKGAYYITHIGASLRFNFTEHLALSASGGFAGAFVGARYKAEERIVNTDASGIIFIEDENETNKFVAGYFGAVNAEYWVTQRTGFYAGVTYEKLDKFEQNPLRDRTASVDIGGGTGFRFGITTKF